MHSEGRESQCGFEVFLCTVILHQLIQISATQNVSFLKDLLSKLLDLLEKNNCEFSFSTAGL